MRKLLLTTLLAANCAAYSAPPVAVDADVEEGRNWNFRVLLNGSEIGYHRFELVDSGTTRELLSEAAFDVRVLFFNAFRYRHMTTEKWDGQCLSEIRSETDANGKSVALQGERTADGFVVATTDDEENLPGCVMTFAYWNPQFLHQSRLLNPQTGEYLDVQVQPLDAEPVSVRGENVLAQPYRLIARNMELTVWYSQNDEWLALESVVKGGRILRYELT